MAPDVANPHDANYHLWTASGDGDVNGRRPSCDLCQTFHLARPRDRLPAIDDRAGQRATAGFTTTNGASEAFTGPCPIGRRQHAPDPAGLSPAAGQALRRRQHPGAGFPDASVRERSVRSACRPPTPASSSPTSIATARRSASSSSTTTRRSPRPNVSSSGGTVTFDVENLTEGRLDDNNSDFAFGRRRPVQRRHARRRHGCRRRGVVFDWTDADRFYEWQVPAGCQRLLALLLSLVPRRAGHAASEYHGGPRGPHVFGDAARRRGRDQLASTSAPTAAASRSPISADGGWHNEMETIRIRTTDFLNNGSALNLANIVAVRLNVGPSFGVEQGPHRHRRPDADQRRDRRPVDASQDPDHRPDRLSRHLWSRRP